MSLSSRVLAFSFTFVIAGSPPALAAADQTPAELLTSARQAIAAGDRAEALKLVGQAIAKDKENPRGYALRARLYDAQRDFEKAVADYTKVIELVPDTPDAYDLRGSEYFKLGRFKEAVADFDRFIQLRPDAEPGHWRRGIAYYYTGEYGKGARQFAGYQTVDDNDVENAVWRYICMAQSDGVEAARAKMLKIGRDPRIPMMKVYDLFLGQAAAADVLAAARSGNPTEAELKQRLFYAHLYLALYYESQGDEKEARTHMKKATEDFPVGGYMWEVARVHSDWLAKKDAKGGVE